MNIAELINELEDMRDVVGDDAEVRYASQPSWPFEYSISNIITMTNEMREEHDRAELQGENVVYLAEGSQLGYLPEDAKNELGW